MAAANPQTPGPQISGSVNFDTNETRSMKIESFESFIITDGQSVLTGGSLSNLNDPVLDTDIATKNYVDTFPGSGVPGGTNQDVQINDGSGAFTGSNNLIWDGSKLSVIGTITDGTIVISGSSLTNLTDPVNAQDGATKNYVDTQSASVVLTQSSVVIQ